MKRPHKASVRALQIPQLVCIVQDAPHLRNVPNPLIQARRPSNKDIGDDTAAVAPDDKKRGSSPEVVPLQEPLNFQNDFNNDSTVSRGGYKFHDGDSLWPRDGAGFY